MALTKVQADGVNLGDDFAFTGDVTGAGLTSPFANSVTSTSEGGAATTNIVQGLAKCWHSMDGIGTVATFGSLNVASIHDSGTGNYGRTFTNPFSNDDYSSTTSASYATGGVKCGSMDSTDGTSRNGGSTRYNNRTFNTGGSDTDANWINATCHGDLA